MFEMIAEWFESLAGWFEEQSKRIHKMLRRAADEQNKARLRGFSATVFIRQPNGSRTNLEHHVEQGLIERGARVFQANQAAGMALLKLGEFGPLAVNAQVFIVGSLQTTDIIIRRSVWTEDHHLYELRRAQHYTVEGQWFRNPAGPRPILRPRESRLEEVEGVNFLLTFRFYHRDGSLLASGTCETVAEKQRVSYEGEFRQLAGMAITHLDTPETKATIKSLNTKHPAA